MKKDYTIIDTFLRILALGTLIGAYHFVKTTNQTVTQNTKQEITDCLKEDNNRRIYHMDRVQARLNRINMTYVEIMTRLERTPHLPSKYFSSKPHIILSERCKGEYLTMHNRTPYIFLNEKEALELLCNKEK
ncbi:hypothetical protein HY486_04365 [Candidatus Woesearchaeota archaeon]|nr:hypothetical protein [Candidatus Woesearchaeota archaeon]